MAQYGILANFLLEEGHGRMGLSPLKSEDWERMRHFTKFLALFKKVNVRIFASNTVATNLYFEELAKIHMHMGNYAANEIFFLAEMTKIMQMKYNKY